MDTRRILVIPEFDTALLERLTVQDYFYDVGGQTSGREPMTTRVIASDTRLFDRPGKWAGFVPMPRRALALSRLASAGASMVASIRDLTPWSNNDEIHSVGLSVTWLVDLLLGQQPCRPFRVAYLNDVHVAQLRKRSRRILMGRSLTHVDAVVVNSQALASGLVTLIPQLRAKVWPLQQILEPPTGVGFAAATAIYLHPEKLAMLRLCQGRGLEIGCGAEKTHPNVIGIDSTPPGTLGTAGNQLGRYCEADLCASGDDLRMIRDQSVDFVVARHNLEHYVDVIQALTEWRRVLRIGGILGVVVPDEGALKTIPLDSTHYHAFTQRSFARLVGLIGGLEIIDLRPCIPGWSFQCVMRRVE